MVGLRWVWLPVLVSIIFLLPAAGDTDNPALKIITYKYGDSREPLSYVADLVRQTRDEPAKRKQLENWFISLLTRKDVTYECKDFICRQLAVIGTKDSLPALKELLLDPETADIARYALERIPVFVAGPVLGYSLPDVPDRVKIGIINSLAMRNCECADQVIVPYLKSKNKELVAASLAALGKLGTPKQAKELLHARVSKNLKRAQADAEIECAYRLIEQDEEKLALKIFKKLTKFDEQPVRIASYKGIIQIGSDKDIAWVKRKISEEDAAKCPELRSLAKP